MSLLSAWIQTQEVTPLGDVDGYRAAVRTGLKRVLGAVPGREASGCTVLIYHRVGGGSPDERDLAVADFEAQLDELASHDVLRLDDALDRIERGDTSPSVVLTFDDGFRDVYEHAWPRLREARLPSTLYLATAFVGGTMHWDGSTAKAAGPALEWAHIEEMASTGLVTVGAHTHNHARPELLTTEELDFCDSAIEERLGTRPRHFAYPWGVAVPRMEEELRRRYRSSVTGELGRNQPGVDLARLRRVPVRRTDPIGFFRAKLRGSLGPEKAYAGMVALAKRSGARA
ncbi:putative polysaccharide deacetylase [Blastococcus saxobsidens DD2]|uniref:Putative polysaccharide deacetylase n=1 Tax=Blastococcus saxobsidens (strain DD2) TaxID=1146883 RepID=H6RMX2_BLASD|nr:putative polysaccharide deacetylase [Blastococcus saxobsidens DD2]